MLPGVALAVLTMLLSLPIAGWMGARILALQGVDPSGAASPISGVLVAILLGLVVRNTIPLPRSVQPGVKFAMRGLLRVGIILVGVKLSLLEIVRLGAWGIPIVAVSIGAGLALVTSVNRSLRLPDRLGTLIAAGTSICGVTAILSVAPAIEADEEEVAYAVANITLFGLVGMFLYPYLAPELLSRSEQVGLFLGVAIHETAQVVGAALTYREVFGDDIAFQVATVTKLTRNLFLAAIVPLLSYLHLRRRDPGARARHTGGGFKDLIPLFVLGFLGMAVLRTIGDTTAARGAAFGIWQPPVWEGIVRQVGDAWGSKYLLGTAMAAVGLGTSFSVFKGVGFRPFLVGLAGALLVGLVGMVLTLTLGSLVQI